MTPCPLCPSLVVQCTALKLRVDALIGLNRNQAKTIVQFISLLEDLAKDIEREHPVRALEIRRAIAQ